MAGTFPVFIEHLVERVGHGELVGRVEFDQVYAHYQEVNDWFAHPRGGQAHYLGGTLLGEAEDSYGAIARELLDEGPVHGMIDAVEHLAEASQNRAPWEKSHLKHSAHPTVTSDGELVYDRAPEQERLSDEELHELDMERMAENPKEHHPYGNRGQSPAARVKQHEKTIAKAQAAQTKARAARTKAGRPPQKSATRRPGFPLPPGSA